MPANAAVRSVTLNVAESRSSSRELQSTLTSASSGPMGGDVSTAVRSPRDSSMSLSFKATRNSSTFSVPAARSLPLPSERLKPTRRSRVSTADSVESIRAVPDASISVLS